METAPRCGWDLYYSLVLVWGDSLEMVLDRTGQRALLVLGILTSRNLLPCLNSSLLNQSKDALLNFQVAPQSGGLVWDQA